MGFNNSDVVVKIWEHVRGFVPGGDREIILSEIMGIFCDELDWDTEDEIEGVWPESENALLFHFDNYG